MLEQTIPPGMSAEHKLRSMLEEDFQNNRLVFSRAGFIDKRHYGRRAGCSNTQYYKRLFLEYEEKSGRWKTKKLLIALLSQDLADGTLKFSRGGKIDRTHYATRLGVTKAALTPHVPVLASFEQKVGGAKRFRDDDLRGMEDWLDHHLEAGTLRLRPGGGLVRAQFKTAFRITHSDFETRFPEVGALIARFDALARSAAVPHVPSPSPSPSPSPASRFDQVSWSPGDLVEAIAGALARDRSIGLLRRNSRGGIDYVFYLAQAVATTGDSSAASVADPPAPQIASPSSVSDPGSLGEGNSIIDAELVVAERIPPIPISQEVPGSADSSLVRHSRFIPQSANGPAFACLSSLPTGDGLPRHDEGNLDEETLENTMGIMRGSLRAYPAMVDDFDAVNRGRNRPNPKSVRKKTSRRNPRSAITAVGVESQNSEREPAADPPDMSDPMEIAVVRRTATDMSKLVDVKTERQAQHHSSERASAAPLSVHSALRKHQLYEQGSRRHRLVEALNNHFDGGGTVPVHRRSLWGKLGVSEVEVTRAERVIVQDYEAASAARSFKVELTDSASAIVAMYPELGKHQHYERGSTESFLVEILNNDLLEGGIPRSRGGKIDRRRLTRMLGFSITAMTYYMDILRDYETATGGLQNRVEVRIPEVEAWLARSMADGTLQVHDGKVERKSLAVRFELSRNKTVFIRNPRLLALVEKYDAIIAETGYLPSSLKQEVERVRIAIANRAPLNSTGLSYDRTALASMTGISIGRITCSPFTEVIADADRKLVSSLERDPLCIIFAGRLFSFRELRDLGWSEAFLTRVSTSFLKAFKTSKKDAPKSAFLALMELLRFLATSADPDCRAVKAGLNTGRATAVDQGCWTRATNSYADRVNERTDLRRNTAHAKLNRANKVIRHLANDRTLPELDLPLKASPGKPQHRRTIAQPPASQGVDDYLAFATLMLDEASRLHGIDVDEEAEAGFPLPR